MSANHFLRMGLDPRWLGAALSALVFFQFALDGGGSETAIWVAGLFLVLQMAYGHCGIRRLPKRLLAVAGMALLILVVSWVFSCEITDTHRSLRFLKFVIVVFSVYCLGRMTPADGLVRMGAAVIALVILWQLAVRHLGASPYGSFERPHYLAYFALLLVPPLILLSLSLKPPYRYALLFLLLPTADLILNDLSRPVIPVLSLAAAAGVVLFFVAAAWRRWAAILWLGLASVVVCYLAPKVVDFFVHDERATIWQDTLRMIAQGDWGSWLVGEGLGSFPEHFPDFSVQEFAYLSLPHNHFFEVFYESGGVALVAVVFALGYVAIQSAQLAWAVDTRPLRGLALCNLAMLVIWFLFSFFVFSVYSSYNLYPLAFIVGIHFLLAETVATRSAPPTSTTRS